MSSKTRDAEGAEPEPDRMTGGDEALSRQETERRALDLRRLASELSDAEHRERKRLAKLLHDDVQQLLSAVRFSLDVAPRVPADQLEDHIRKIDEMVVTCQETARSLTYELSPPILQAGTLVEVAEWLVRWFADHHGLRVDLSVAGQVPAASEHGRVLLFQVLREVLFNIVKHAGTLVARVDLSTRNGFLIVVVEDDGDGFDPQAVESRLQRPTSFGLFNIRERLDALGGGLVIDATPQRGARLRLELPLAEDLEPEPAIPPPRELDAATARTPEAGPKEGVIRLLVVGLSFHEDEAYVRAMIEAGADAYASKSDPSDHVIATIRRAYGGCRG